MGGGFKRRKIPRELMLDPPPRKSRWWLWLILASGFIVTGLFAANVMAYPDAGTGELWFRSTDGNFDAALHLATRYETVVTGVVANTTLTQSFENPSQEWREAVYVFPLPETAAIHAMRIRIADRLIAAEIQERGQATKTYADARAAGKAAALTEQERPNLFTQSVANIPPGETVEVTITFIQVVDYADGRFTLRLPLTLTPRYIPGLPDSKLARSGAGSGWAMPTADVADADRITPFMTTRPGRGSHEATIAITLNPGLALVAVVSPHHGITTREQDGVHRVSLRDGAVPMDRDFLLEWRPTANARPRAAFFGEHIDGNDYGLLLLMPPTVREVVSLPRELVFIIDTSGSMKGESIRQARRALRDALGHLRHTDRFNIVAFASDYTTLFAEPGQVDTFTLEMGRRFVDRLNAGGGTEMRAPLEAVLRRPAADGFLKQIVFITDGAVGNEVALFRTISDMLGQTRLFTIGIGSAPNSFFMRKAAQFGRGSFVHIGAIDEVHEKIATLIEKIDRPVSQEIEVTWPSSTAVESFPDRLPALYAGEPVVVLVRGRVLFGDGVVAGKSRYLAWRESVPVTVDERGSGIATLWARAKVESLLDEKTLGADAGEVRQAVLELGLTHHLVTPYTSLVAVERYVSRLSGDPLAREAVPNQVARGQKVATMMMPSTSTHSTLAFVLGVSALFLAACIGWAGRKACD